MSLSINVNFDKEKDIWDVNLDGEIDIYTANTLKEQLSVVSEDKISDIKINMQNLEYIDSTGLGILIGILKRLKQKDFL